MRCARTRLSAAAGGATALLGLLLMWQLLRGGGAPYVELLVGLAAVVAVAAGVKLWRDSCFGSRFAAVLVALASAVGNGLASSVGVPGVHTGRPSLLGLSLVAVGVAIPLLVAIDARARQRTTAGVSPYAS